MIYENLELTSDQIASLIVDKAHELWISNQDGGSDDCTCVVVKIGELNGPSL